MAELKIAQPVEELSEAADPVPTGLADRAELEALRLNDLSYLLPYLGQLARDCLPAAQRSSLSEHMVMHAKLLNEQLGCVAEEIGVTSIDGDPGAFNANDDRVQLLLLVASVSKIAAGLLFAAEHLRFPGDPD